MIVFGMAVIVGKCGPRFVSPGFKVTSCLTIVFLICLETVLLCTESDCATKSFRVHWNTTNSMFRIDNTDHIIDVNKGNVQFEYDQVNLICPVYVPGTLEKNIEKYIIYNVSKEEYETCRITNPNPKIIAICDKPHKLMYFTITFRPFTPQPGGLEFLPGNDYYFISTSSAEDLHRRVGGRCTSNNMKIVFKVCCAPGKDAQNSSSVLRAPGFPPGYASPPITVGVHWPARYPPGPNPDFSPETSTLVFVQHASTSRPVSPTQKPTKKTNKFDKHPNEVMKNEELTYNGSSHPSSMQSLLSIITVAILMTCLRWR